MNFRRRVAVLSLTAGVLVLAIVAGLAFSPEARRSRETRGGILLRDPAEIDTLEISDSSGLRVFRRLGAAWVLDEDGAFLPARAERIEAYLTILGSLRSREEVSRREASWETLGLDDTSGRRIRLLLRDGSAAADFRVGRYSPDGSRVFLRMERDPRGYAVPGPVASRLPTARTTWLDLRVFGEPVPLEDVMSLRISGSLTFPDGTAFGPGYTLERDRSGGWTSKQIPDPDPAAVGRLVRSWMNAEADDFTARDVAGVAGGPRSELRVDLELGGGTLRSLRITGPADPEGRFAVIRTGGYGPMALSPWILRDLLKSPGELSIPSVP